jgi:hypothetical protein
MPKRKPRSDELVPIFINSSGISTEMRKDENGKVKRFIKGQIAGTKLLNGKEVDMFEPFEVECDKQVEVAPHIAEALKPLCTEP